MTDADVVKLLRNECDKAGGQKHWAIAHNLSQAYVSDVLKGNRGLGAAICEALGLVQVVTYKRRIRVRATHKD